MRLVTKIEWTSLCPIDYTLSSRKGWSLICLFTITLLSFRMKVRLSWSIPAWALKKTEVEGSSGTVA